MVIFYHMVYLTTNEMLSIEGVWQVKDKEMHRIHRKGVYFSAQ